MNRDRRRNIERELAAARGQIARMEDEIRRLDGQRAQQSQRLDRALAQLHRRCPCETCAHGNGKGGCTIGGCTYTRADNLDLWTWNGWEGST